MPTSERRSMRLARHERCTGPGLVFAVLVILFGQPAWGQPIAGLAGAKEEAAASDPTTADAIAARRAQLAQELAASSDALADAADESRRAHLEAVRDRLGGIDRLLRKQAELAAPRPGPAPSEPASEQPPSVFTLNELYEARVDAEQRREWLTEALGASREALADAKEKLEEAETARREARSELEAAEAPPSKLRAERALELARLASRAAQERVHLRRLETRIASREVEAIGAVSDLEARIAKTREAIRRGEDASSEGFAALTEEQGAARRELERVQRGLATLELRLEAAQQRFSRQADPSSAVLEEVEALTATRDAIRQEVALLEARLERLSEQRALWQEWQALLRGEGRRDELASQKAAAVDRIDTLEQAALYARGQRSDLERGLEAVDERLAQLPADARALPVLEEQRVTLARVLDVARVEAAALASDRRLSERVLDELRDRTGDVDPLEVLARAVQLFPDVWSYEITSVDDAPITVGSLLLALFLAGVGLWAARRGSALVGRVAIERFRLDAGAASALQTLSFYVLLVSFTLLALRAVHFPLTAFTVLGGALAIGIGFGSQNVMNNFISGLILMLERPVRAGDVVEVDGNHGTIERIGARSTQIRSVDGRHIVVPNSFFLENNVVNWTLSDDLIRTSVLVGVIYGSPTRLVEELIRKVVDEDDQVLKHPEPILLFDEFGDNSLNFEAHFWVRARSPMAMRRVQSRLRFRIDDLFREHGLVIAFPQRDVHLDSASPIEVRMVQGGGQPPDPADA
jgi:potassium efflux system protein